MDNSYSGAIKSPTCMIPLSCLIRPKIPSDQWHFIYPKISIAFGLIEPFSTNPWHAIDRSLYLLSKVNTVAI